MKKHLVISLALLAICGQAVNAGQTKNDDIKNAKLSKREMTDILGDQDRKDLMLAIEVAKSSNGKLQKKLRDLQEKLAEIKDAEKAGEIAAAFDGFVENLTQDLQKRQYVKNIKEAIDAAAKNKLTDKEIQKLKEGWARLKNRLGQIRANGSKNLNSVKVHLPYLKKAASEALMKLKERKEKGEKIAPAIISIVEEMDLKPVKGNAAGAVIVGDEEYPFYSKEEEK